MLCRKSGQKEAKFHQKVSERKTFNLLSNTPSRTDLFSDLLDDIVWIAILENRFLEVENGYELQQCGTLNVNSTRMPVNTTAQSNLFILLQVSGNVAHIDSAIKKDHWFVLLNLVCMNTSSDGCVSPMPRWLEHVCFFANF